MKQLFVFLGGLGLCSGHGVMVWPPSNRHGGTSEKAGKCIDFECMWFSQPVMIPGVPTLDPKFRTFNLGINNGPYDWTKKMPWRSPGAAPVLGSGCGVAGGNKVVLFNGGFNPPGYAQGMDGIYLPPAQAHIWKRGETPEVAFALTANHGGGYSYRLCRQSENETITEECFQRTPLKFAGEKSWFQYGEFVPNQPRYEVPLMKTNTGTTPPGSEWARLPVPACKICDQLLDCGPELQPDLTEVSGQMPDGSNYYGGQKWIDQVDCGSKCAGATPINGDLPPPTNDNTTNYGLSDGLICPPGKTQFVEVLPGISGFLANHSYPEKSIIAFSIVDRIIVPDVPDGTYLLSWRWDCEQAYQIWQNCADIQIQGSVYTPSPSPHPAAIPPPADQFKTYFIIAIALVGGLSAVAFAVVCYRLRQLKADTPILREPLTKSIQSTH